MNKFLSMYSRQTQELYVEAKNLGISAEPIPDDPAMKTPIWYSNMIGCFFNYLAYDAHSHCNVTKPKLAWSSASGYASSIKVFFQNKFRESPLVSEISIFRAQQWNSIRGKLFAAFTEIKRKTGERLTNPHKASNPNDRRAIGIGCLWANDPQMAEFWHLNNSMTHCSGRGSEVAGMRISHLDTVQMNELYLQYDIIQADITRHKNGHHQSISIFPHKDCMAEDWYFSLIYQIIMMGEFGDFICPEFGSKSMQESEDKSDSKVSGLWVNVFKKLIPGAQTWNANLQVDLTSHHGKKGSNMIMANSPSASGLPQIFRSGWEVRGFHSLFDYVVGTAAMCYLAGKAIANWTVPGPGGIMMGGIPPSFREITSDLDKLQEFTSYLFANDDDNVWPMPIRELLVCSLLRHYEECTQTLHQLPGHTFGENLEEHVFVSRVRVALSQADVSEETFTEWQKQIKKGFLQRNMESIPLNGHAYLGGEALSARELLMDPRCFLDQQNALVAAFQAIRGQFDQLQSAVNTQAASYDSLVQRVDLLESQLPSVLDHFEKRLDTQEEYLRAIFHTITNGHSSAELPHTRSPGATTMTMTTAVAVSPSVAEVEQQSYQPSYSLLLKSYKDGMSAEDHFVYFFRDQCWKAYQYEQTTQQWSNLAAKERRALTQKFGRQKETVMAVLMNCEHCPYNRPTGSAREYQQWVAGVKELGNRGASKLRARLEADGDISGNQNLSQAKVRDSKYLKECKKDIKEHLPKDTPADLIELFIPSNKGGTKRTVEEVVDVAEQ